MENPKNRALGLDLRVGQRFKSDGHKVDEEQIVTFAKQFDPQAFHLDDEAAKRSIFGGLAASGWHTAALTMRLNVEGGLPIVGGIVGLGGEIEWMHPVRPGDQIHVESEVTDLKLSRSRPDSGVVTVRCATVNQRGEVVQTCVMRILVQ